MQPSIFHATRLSTRISIRSTFLQDTRLCKTRDPFLQSRYPRHGSYLVRYNRVTLRSSYSSYALIFVVACACAAASGYLSHRADFTLSEPAPPPVIEAFPQIEDERNPVYSKMAKPEGTLGNLTPQQEVKLREFWTLTLKTFGVKDPDHPDGTSAGTDQAPSIHSVETPDKKKKKRGFFSRGKHDSDAPDSPSSTATMDEDDKYGQTAELQQILKTVPPESLRATFWEMMKHDHPDALLLRFLRARKWDVDKALAMLITTMNWRGKEMRVDDDIMINGEAGALAESKGSNPSAKKEGNDFLAQMRMGKSFIHGTDKEGRPITYVRVRLHKGGEHSEKAIERYTVFVIETARIMLRHPVETGCIVFDMTNFTLANMDYTPVKFMIKVFEANYPESLGAVLVHKAPWIFQGIWKIIRGWLDPVVAAKVHFTNSIEDMQAFVPKNQVIKELGGDDDWEYKYIESVEGENDAMKDTATKERLQNERKQDIEEFQTKTFKWIATGQNKEESTKLDREREALATRLNDNYWQLDPYVRARSLYDRVGMIQKGGKINFYPQHTLKAENVNGSTTVGSDPPKHDIDPDDDVD